MDDAKSTSAGGSRADLTELPAAGFPEQNQEISADRHDAAKSTFDAVWDRVMIVVNAACIVGFGALVLLVIYVSAGSGGGQMIRWMPPLTGPPIIRDDGLGIPSEWLKRQRYLKVATRPSDITVEFLKGPLIVDRPADSPSNK